MVVRSEKTREAYAIIIKKLRDACAPGSSGYEFLLDTEKILAYIDGKDYANNTKKNYFISLKSVLRDLGDPSYKPAEAVYERRMLACAEQHDKEAVEQQLSEREKKLYVSWPSIVAADEKLRESVSDFFDFQDYVIYCLYTYQPPSRVDYADMRVVHTLKEAQDMSGNFLVSEYAGMCFVFKEYKTAYKYGTRVVPIKRNLRKVLEEWLELNPSGWLLCDQKGRPVSDKYLAQMVRTVMQKAVGKPLGVNLLRHSFVTHYRRGEKSLKSQQEVAHQMGHSTSMSQLYRRIDAQ